VVEKLFELLKPNKAYFGEKDFQQILIIKKLVEKMNIKPEIISCPIIRNLEGLALSSRNRMLSSELKLLVPVIYKTLLQVKEDFGFMNSQEIIKSVYDNFQLIPMLTLDYFTIRDSEFLIPISKIQLTKNYRAFIAVKADKIRLIDNLKLSI
jgi:pantoate--beta-alanine ligase